MNKIKMTIDECIEFAREWSKGMTFHAGSQGWRVVCMLLAEEVQRLRGTRTASRPSTGRRLTARGRTPPISATTVAADEA